MSFGSMYVGASGMVAHDDWMQTIGNNLANVNTTAFKGASVGFETLMSKDHVGGHSAQDGSTVGAGQIGLGVRVAEVKMNLQEGGFEAGTTATDLAIGGKGYFRVVSDEGDAFYTRAGNFRFDRFGTLRTSHGHTLQGFAIDSETGDVSNVASNIQLPTSEVEVDGQLERIVLSEPRATTSVRVNANLDSSQIEGTRDDANPYFALATSWNGTADQPLEDDKYIYQDKIRIYDETGAAHDLNIFYDPAGGTRGGLQDGRHYWEYIVTVDPSEDGSATGSSAGMLMAGVMTFDSKGEMQDLSAFSLSGNDHTNLSNWAPSALSETGQPLFDISFPGGGTQTITMDFGINGTGNWVNTPGSAAEVGSNAGNLPQLEGAVREAMSMTTYNGTSATLNQNQDGYAQGFLQNISFNTDGVMTGKFSNGQSEELFKVANYIFSNEYGLRREGGNLFMATGDSGPAIEGEPGEANHGVIYQETLETSNVDMANEFASMIRSQRGFQANSKIVTTADGIINNLLQVKK